MGNEVPPSDWHVFFERFAHLAVLIHAAGKKVVLPAAATYNETDFLRAVPGRLWSQIDGVDVHPPVRRPEWSRQRVLQNLQAARALVPNGIPLFVDEVGWALLTRIALYPPPLVVRDEQTQAAKLTRTYTLLYEHRAELDLRQVDWFAYGDFPGTAFAPWMGPWWQHAGLVRLDGSRRPSYAALAAIRPERR